MATLLAACKGSSEPLGPTATLAHATTTTNPYAVPTVIDEAYVNRVLAGLDEAIGDVTRLVLTAKKITNEAADRLEALYLGNALAVKLRSYQGDVLRNFAGYRSNPGNKVTTVDELLSVRPSCIFAKVVKEFSAVTVNTNSQPSTQWVALVPHDTSKDPFGYNKVGWMFAFDGFQEDRSAPEDPCADLP